MTTTRLKKHDTIECSLVWSFLLLFCSGTAFMFDKVAGEIFWLLSMLCQAAAIHTYLTWRRRAREMAQSIMSSSPNQDIHFVLKEPATRTRHPLYQDAHEG